jgi:hypothetical protein
MSKTLWDSDVFITNSVHRIHIGPISPGHGASNDMASDILGSTVVSKSFRWRGREKTHLTSQVNDVEKTVDKAAQFVAGDS